MPIFASAQDGVLLLEPELVSLGVDEEGRVTSLGEYLNGLFLLGIGLASGLAVIYITIGGVQYMVTASSDNKTAAREKIMAAVSGLLLALASFVILNTINPDLLEFNIQDAINDAVTGAKALQGDPPFGAPGDEWGPGDAGNLARAALIAIAGDRISFNNPECKNIGDRNCTSLAGINQRLNLAMKGLTDRCGCAMRISGGTEYWLHGNGSQDPRTNPTRHKPGNATVDLTSLIVLNTYIMEGHTEFDNPLSLGCPTGTGFERVQKDGITFQWEPKGCNDSTGNHWHVDF